MICWFLDFILVERRGYPTKFAQPLYSIWHWYIFLCRKLTQTQLPWTPDPVGCLLFTVFWLRISRKKLNFLQKNFVQAKKGFPSAFICKRYIQVAQEKWLRVPKLVFLLHTIEVLALDCFHLSYFFSDEWENFLERMRRKNSEGLDVEINDEDLRNWASFRGQTLSRTGVWQSSSMFLMLLVIDNY